MPRAASPTPSGPRLVRIARPSWGGAGQVDERLRVLFRAVDPARELRFQVMPVALRGPLGQAPAFYAGTIRQFPPDALPDLVLLGRDDLPALGRAGVLHD